jgi:hypothetical protein
VLYCRRNHHVEGERTDVKHLLTLVIGLLLAGALFGAAAAHARTESRMAQRATSTPSPAASPTATRRLPVTLAARPLPVLIPVTTTATISATPPFTTTPALTETVRATPTPRSTLRGTPTPDNTPAPRATPTDSVAAADAPADATADMTGFSALASRLRGQIDLRWRYAGEPFDGSFVIERSANGGVWRYVADCTQPYAPDAYTYRCRDTELTSGSTYAYRGCIVGYGASCADAAVVESDPVKAP